MKKLILLLAAAVLLTQVIARECPNLSGIPEGFTALFNCRDFTRWKVPEGDNGHWKIIDGVIDYDAESEADDKNLWSKESFGDFILFVDWRIKATPYKNQGVPIILPDGSHKQDEKGPIALQHHGTRKDGTWVSPPSLVQFRNILIKEL